jgi:hypothetical protein
MLTSASLNKGEMTMSDFPNSWDQSGKDKGGLEFPGGTGIPKDDEKAKQTNAPVIRTETKEAAEDVAKLAKANNMNDVNEMVEKPARAGTELTDMMRAPKGNFKFLAEGKSKQEILDAYGGIEGNIPYNHPTYWGL